MLELLEITMIVSFGISWSLNVIKSYKARAPFGELSSDDIKATEKTVMTLL